MAWVGLAANSPDSWEHCLWKGTFQLASMLMGRTRKLGPNCLLLYRDSHSALCCAFLSSSVSWTLHRIAVRNGSKCKALSWISRCSVGMKLVAVTVTTTAAQQPQVLRLPWAPVSASLLSSLSRLGADIWLRKLVLQHCFVGPYRHWFFLKQKRI